MMILAEEGDKTARSTNDALFNMFNTTAGANGYDYGAYTYRHNGGANFLHVDGHVKWQSATSTAALNAPAGYAATVCAN
jgi:prepilin-type processing-associated H-X9-DG protein